MISFDKSDKRGYAIEVNQLLHLTDLEPVLAAVQTGGATSSIWAMTSVPPSIFFLFFSLSYKFNEI